MDTNGILLTGHRMRTVKPLPISPLHFPFLINQITTFSTIFWSEAKSSNLPQSVGWRVNGGNQIKDEYAYVGLEFGKAYVDFLLKALFCLVVSLNTIIR